MDRILHQVKIINFNELFVFNISDYESLANISCSCVSSFSYFFLLHYFCYKYYVYGIFFSPLDYLYVIRTSKCIYTNL